MRLVHIIYTVVGVIVLSGLAWFVFTPRDMEPMIIYKTAMPDAPRVTETPTTQRQPRAAKAGAAPDQQVRVRSQVVEERSRERLQAALESPAYLEYSRKQAERIGFNVVLWWEFLEAAGIQHNGRILQAEAFEKYFPDGGAYADYEPMMRLAVAEMFLEDPDQSVMDVLQRFNAVQSNRVWRFGHFNGYEGEYEWGQQIQRDAANIVATATRTPETFELPDFSDAPPDTEVPASDATPEDSTFEPSINPKEIPRVDALETLPQTLEALEAQFFKQYTTGLPKLPSEATLETTLRERFSPERFNTAMQTLHRHGPQEGLRQLKTTDPEVAAYIERGLHRGTAADAPPAVPDD